MPEAQQNDPAPKVDGVTGGTILAAGWSLDRISGAMAGEKGIRVLALVAVGSFTWVATRAIDKYVAMQTETDAILVRSREEGVEREKADNSRREKEMRDWMSAELEKQRFASSNEAERQRQANVLSTAAQVAAFALEREKDRAMVFRLAGAKMPPEGGGP